jgi:hypothetical protein
LNWSNLPEKSIYPYWRLVSPRCPICNRELIRLDERAYAFCAVHRYRLTDEQLQAAALAILDAVDRLNTLSMKYAEPLPFDLSPEAADIEATRGANT